MLYTMESTHALLLGLDIGTTNIKCMIANDLLEVETLAESECDIVASEGGRVEQNPDEWWSTLIKVVRKALEGLDDDDIKQIVSISLSSQGGTLVLVDKYGQILYPAISWLDQRSRLQKNKLEERFGLDFFYLKTGWGLNEGLPLPKMLWLKENEPEVFQNVSKFLNTSDYIAYKLTGEYLIDSSSACITMLYNLSKRQWDEDILSIAGISKERLSEIVNPSDMIGKLTDDAARVLGLPKGIPVYAGGHDQFCVALGAGVIEPGEVILSGGTAWVLVSITDNLIFDTKNYLAVEEHVISDRWGLIASIPAGGASMKWLRDMLKREYKDIDRGVEDIISRDNTLFFFPYLTGAGSPHRNLEHLGTILGLKLEYDYKDIAKSLMEGVGYEVLWILEAFRDLKVEPRKLKMVGGCTRSPVWPQLIANITGVGIDIPEVSECGALGASILAGLGAQVFTSSKAISDLYKSRISIFPNKDLTNKYLQLFKCYRTIYDDLSKLYKKISEISR
ncbi:MAG TPA: FGGY family carbohydrate kinase [bacterium]|nr:FGGY family carbohydrate kinase [bacterium]